jgi:carbon monoxide dehydrogenase subunit G
MKSTLIECKVSIQATKEKVWAALADFGNVYRISPNITSSHLTSDQKNGIGATRHCDLTLMGAQVEERITKWEEGNSLEIEIYEAKNMPMVKDMVATFLIEKNGNENSNTHTILKATFEYRMSNFLGDVMNMMGMKKSFSRSFYRFIAGIKHHVETGNDINRESLLDVNAVMSL